MSQSGFTAGPSYYYGLTQIQAAQAQGIQIGISFGGASGTDLALACTQPELQAAYQSIIDTYLPSFLDFDIEQGR